MSMRLFSANTPVNKLPLTWNTVRSKTRPDVKNGACSDTADYKNIPCNGKEIQEWAWVFTPDNIVLTCDSEILYLRQTGFQDPESCKLLGSDAVDTLEFTNMKGFFYRGFPIYGVLEDKESDSEGSEREARSDIGRNEEEETSEADIVITDKTQDLPTCNCWTRECGYCSNLECAVKHDMSTSQQALTVTSQVDLTLLNSIVLYNRDGVELGKFQWNKKGIYLTGCVACRTPRPIRRLIRSHSNDNDGTYKWQFTFSSGVLKLRVSSGGADEGLREHVYQQTLIGECARHYSDISYFSFYRMGCGNTFNLVDSMVAGSRVSSDCSDTCLRK